MTSIGRGFSHAVELVIHGRNSYPIDRVKHTRVGLILLVGSLLIEGRPQTALTRIECLHKVGVVVNIKGLNMIST